MTDIVERLRKWANVVPVPPAAQTMAEAAAEIQRLRLTDEEREAVEAARGCLADHDAREGAIDEVLRKLLERLK